MTKTARNKAMKKPNLALNNADYGAASSSVYRGTAFNNGHYGVAFNGGRYGVAFNCGYRGVASNNAEHGVACSTGEQSTAINCGYSGQVSGAEGCALFLVERDDEYKILNVWSGIVGQNDVKPETWYSLKNGQLVEIESKS